MSNLRWILLFAGFAILLLLYFSGRPRKTEAYDGQGRRDPDDLENHLGRNPAGLMPAGATEMPYSGSQGDYRGEFRGEYQGEYQGDLHAGGYQNDPLLEAGSPGQNTAGYMPTQNAGQQYAGQTDPQYTDPQYLEAAHGFSDMDPADMVRPGGGYVDNAMQQEGAPLSGHDTQYSNAVAPRMQYAEDPAYEAAPVGHESADLAIAEAPVAPAPTTLGGKLDAFSARFTSRRKKSAASSKGNATGESDNPMVILLHVAAPEGQMIDGQLLLQVFEQRRYHFGEKNIFHSLHQGKTVFSIAKMVEPGFFDVNDISSFETPGLLLILQLPGPVAGEAAFEVLISEARELSDALGCRVLDSKRSTLSRQTTQHLRESVCNYVHRQKYFKKANAS